MPSQSRVLSFLSISLGYLIFGSYALSLRYRFDFPLEVYWLSFVFVCIPIVCEAAFWKGTTKLRLFYLLSFSLMIHLQYAVVDSSQLLSSVDAVGDYRLTERIISDSQWNPFSPIEWGFGSEYRFYPVTNFIYSTMALLTGIPLVFVVRYLFVVKALAVTPIVDRWFRSFFHQRVAYLATILFFTSPGAILFPHKESFALIFFFLAIYVITRTSRNREYLLIGLISTLTLAMTHHFTTYVFLFLLTSFFLASHFFKQERNRRVSSQFFILCCVVFVLWDAFVASSSVYHQTFLYEAILRLLFPGKLAVTEVLQNYALYESVIVWLGTGIAAISACIGFLIYVRNRKNLSPTFFMTTLFLIPFLGVATILRFSPSGFGGLVSHRAFEFGYIIIGAFSALLFIRAYQSTKTSTLKGVLVGIIIIMIMVGPITGSVHPRTFSKVSDVISSQAVSLNSWMSESDASNGYTIVDEVGFLIISAYANSKAIEYPEWFASPDFKLPPDIGSLYSYVVTYKYMKDFYGPNAGKFEATPLLHNIYANGILNVYSISEHTSL